MTNYLDSNPIAKLLISRGEVSMVQPVWWVVLVDEYRHKLLYTDSNGEVQLALSKDEHWPINWVKANKETGQPLEQA